MISSPLAVLTAVTGGGATPQPAEGLMGNVGNGYLSSTSEDQRNLRYRHVPAIRSIYQNCQVGSPYRTDLSWI